MLSGSHFLTSVLARRFLFLFLLCAFLPTSILLGFSYKQVTQQLLEQSWTRMDKEGKSYAMTLFDRLAHMDNLLRLYATAMSETAATPKTLDALRNEIAGTFSWLGNYRDETSLPTINSQTGQTFHADFLDSILQGQEKTVLYLGKADSLVVPVFFLVPYRNTTHTGLLIARPDEALVWGIGAQSLLPPNTELAVYGEDGKQIMGTEISPGAVLPPQSSRTGHGNYLQFEFTHEGTAYLASGWSLFMQSRFVSPSWTIILSMSQSDALGAMLDFRKTFPLIVALSLWIILFLSLFFIRRTLTPLQILQEGTRRISGQDFTSRVEITSGDEFEQLAESFNTMSSKLDNQFNTLLLRNEIDRSILSSLDPGVTVPRALRMIAGFFSCRLIILAQFTSEAMDALRLTMLEGGSRNDLTFDHLVCGEEERLFFQHEEPYRVCGPLCILPGKLGEMTRQGQFLFLPLEAKGKVRGALILDLPETLQQALEEKIKQARQLADQLAVALSNARLVADLERLSIGTVEALARTVDAKSRWTAGHSERVADLSVRLGKALRCSDDLQEQLFRGGLLHDIGKIGIPVAVLDKPGKLSDDEYATIKTHPEIGGKILEPIEVYQDILSIVVQHHERFDGKGYPSRLAGEEISFGARILCVADVYDALISQRPYRQGWVKDKVLLFIKENRGIMFDPTVVDAFLSMEADLLPEPPLSRA